MDVSIPPDRLPCFNQNAGKLSRRVHILSRVAQEDSCHWIGPRRFAKLLTLRLTRDPFKLGDLVCPLSTQSGR